jgi:hypothetical protein
VVADGGGEDPTGAGLAQAAAVLTETITPDHARAARERARAKEKEAEASRRKSLMAATASSSRANRPPSRGTTPSSTVAPRPINGPTHGPTLVSNSETSQPQPSPRLPFAVESRGAGGGEGLPARRGLPRSASAATLRRLQSPARQRATRPSEAPGALRSEPPVPSAAPATPSGSSHGGGRFGACAPFHAPEGALIVPGRPGSGSGSVGPGDLAVGDSKRVAWHTPSRATGEPEHPAFLPPQLHGDHVPPEPPPQLEPPQPQPQPQSHSPPTATVASSSPRRHAKATTHPQSPSPRLPFVEEAAEPSALAAQLSRGLAALEAGADFDLVERALREEAAAAAEAEAAALKAAESLGLGAL